MGKKQRRTRWRRLSLGDASGPEEEDDETQQPQPEQPEKPEKPEKPVEEPVEEQERAEGGACTAETDAERRVKQEPRGSSPASSTASVEMPGEQAAHQRPWTGKPGAKQAPSGAYGPPGGARPAPAPGGFRRPRYNNAPPSAGYGRANSWNSYEHAKTHGIEKKIFNDEEYTKISTPRQEVLFKKGSIGAKKRPTAPSAANDSGSEHDSGHASASPTSPGAHLNGDADSFHYSGNDNGSTGDASSTAGDAVGSDGSALAAGYDAPLVCFPMYDFYGGYPGVYAGGMLVQTYPGGPLVPAVPVPVPVQAVDWYGRGSASASSPGSPPQGELGFYYALGYPTAAVAADVSAPNETGASNSRRNSLESCQASSAEASEGSPSETGSSPTSSGPSSQGPASPQSEPANGSPEKGAQSGASVAAAAATVMDMAMERKMPVAGFLYPYPAYGLAPPLYAGY